MRKAFLAPIVLFSAILLSSIANAAPALNLPSMLPDAKIGEEYSYQLQVIGGSGQYFFDMKITDLTRAPGTEQYLELLIDSDTGKINGTLTRFGETEGVYQLQICVSDVGLTSAVDWEAETAPVCKNALLYVLSDDVTTKGNGDITTSRFVWKPPYDINKGLLTANVDSCESYQEMIQSVSPYTEDAIRLFFQSSSQGSAEHPVAGFEYVSSPMDVQGSGTYSNPSISSCKGNAEANASAIIKENKVEFSASARADCYMCHAYEKLQYYASGHPDVYLFITNTGTTARSVDITVSGTLSRIKNAVGDGPIMNYISGRIGSRDSWYNVQTGIQIENYDQLIQAGKIDETELNFRVSLAYDAEPGATNSSTITKRFVVFPGKHMLEFSLNFGVGDSYCYCTGKDLIDGVDGNFEVKITPVAPAECPDTIPPMTTATAVDGTGAAYIFGQQTLQSPVKIEFDCVDLAPLGCDTSGCRSTFYCTDTTNTCDPDALGPKPVEIGTWGTYYVRYYSIDNAGNKEGVQSQRIVLGSKVEPAGTTGQVPEQPKPPSTPPSIIIQNDTLVPPILRSNITYVSDRNISPILVDLFGWSEWKAVSTSTCIRGASCSSPTDCCGALCSEGYCLCGVKACSASGECCTGYCEEGQCTTPPTMSLFFSKPLQGCAGLVDECLPGEGGCIVICGALTFLMLASALSSGLYSWRRFNHPVPGIIAAITPLFVGMLLYTFVGIISAFAIIAMLSYLRRDVKVIPMPSNLSDILQILRSKSEEPKPVGQLQNPAEQIQVSKTRTTRTAKTPKK